MFYGYNIYSNTFYLCLIYYCLYLHSGSQTCYRLLEFSPVFAGLLLENSVAVIHALFCGDVNASLWVVFNCLSQHVVNNAFSILPHVAQWSPDHIDGLVPLSKKVLGFLD